MSDHVGVGLLAICDPPSTDERVHTLILLGAALLVVLVIAVLVLRRRGERGRLVATYAVATLAGAMIATVAGGLHADADILARFLIGVAVGGVIGLGVSAVRRRRPVSYAVAGLMGGATFWAGALALLIGALAIGGSCLD
jgi:peptidoglycan/LPS O-acetylase OafA/YrhL